MRTIKLTQLQWDVLESATWGTTDPKDMIVFREVERGTTVAQIKTASKQLAAKGFVRVSKSGDVNITQLGSLARDVAIAQDDLEQAQEKFERKQAKAAIKQSFPRRK